LRGETKDLYPGRVIAKSRMEDCSMFVPTKKRIGILNFKLLMVQR